MFFACFSFLGLPLVLSAYLLLEHWGVWTHHAEEQVQLDASLLTACHREMNFLNHYIPSSNNQIENLREKMNSAVLLCQAEAALAGAAAAAADPPNALAIYRRAYRARMKICNRVDIFLLSVAGKGLELYQSWKLIQNYRRQKQWLFEAAKMNGLDRQSLQESNLALKKIPWKKLNLNLSSFQNAVHRSASGFERKKIPPKSRASEDLIAQYGHRRAWPRNITPSQDFSSFYFFKASYLPQQLVFRSDLKMHKLRLNDRSPYHSASACQLIAKSESHFEVRRKLAGARP